MCENKMGVPTETPKADPWVHRSAGMRCSTCMWGVRKGETPLGRCRRHAPTMSGYPAIFMETDWCGDHKLDEVSVDEPKEASNYRDSGFAKIGVNAKPNGE